MHQPSPPSSPRVLIVEDEQAIADTLIYALGTEGFATEHRLLGGEALELLAAGGIDLVVLDIGLPDMNGFDVCRELRSRNPIPVLFLTARGDEIDRIVGLELGAGDYVVKPFSPREVAVRVRNLLRRSAPGGPASGAQRRGRSRSSRTPGPSASTAGPWT
jgi:two-component system catabolic regulation response regulator CreB